MFRIGRMTRTRKSTQKNKNTNPFKQMVGMRSLARGSTRSNRRMKTAKNFAAWHNQIQNVLKQQHRETELLGISGRAHAAFHGNAESTLPAHATKAERNAAIYQRLMSELASLEVRGHHSNANKRRMANLRHAVREYAPRLWLGGTRSKPRSKPNKPPKTVTFTNRQLTLRKLLPVLSRYVGEPENKLKAVFDPAIPMRNGASKAQAVRSLIKEALDEFERAPDSVQKHDDEPIIRAAANISMPTGVAPYGMNWRNVLPTSNSTRRNNNMNGGGCGCSGGTPPLFPSA
jgi:hypothetical protein